MLDPKEIEQAFSDFWYSQTDFCPDDTNHVHYNAAEIGEDRLTFYAGWKAALAKRAEMFKEYTRAGQSLPETVEGADLKRLSEMNAPKIEYPALYRKLLSPEEFTD